MPETLKPKPLPLHVQAAKASWKTPLIAIFLFSVLGKDHQNQTVTVVIAGFSQAIIVAGFAFALWGIMAGLSKGPRWLLVPAGVGLILNGVFVYAAIDGFWTAHHRAEQLETEKAARQSGDWIPTGKEWFVDRDYGFAIIFPDDWEIVPVREQGTSAYAISPLESEDDTFRESMKVMSVQFSPRVSSSRLVEQELERCRERSIGDLETETGTKMIHGMEWHWIKYRQLLDGVQLDLKTFLVFQNGLLYYVTYACLPESPAALEEQFNQSLASIKLP